MSAFAVLSRLGEESVQKDQMARQKGWTVKWGHIPGTSGAGAGGAGRRERRDRSGVVCVRLPGVGDAARGTKRQKDFRALSHLASEVDKR